MDKDTWILKLEQMVAELLADAPDFFVVQVRIKPTNNFKVFIDGDHGVTIEDCIKLNRKLYKQLEEGGHFPDGDFSLEVSSPGVGEPLKLQRQYVKNTGRLLQVVMTDGTTHTGILKAAGPEGIELEVTTGKGKKAVVANHTIGYSVIKEATVQIQF